MPTEQPLPADVGANAPSWLKRSVGRLTCVSSTTRSRTRPMADYRDHHGTIFLPPEVAGSIEAARREWDPDMANRIAAHVTLVYPQEAPTPSCSSSVSAKPALASGRSGSDSATSPAS